MPSCKRGGDLTLDIVRREPVRPRHPYDVCSEYHSYHSEEIMCVYCS